MVEEDLKLQIQSLITIFGIFSKDSIKYQKSYKVQFSKAKHYFSLIECYFLQF
jgi:hypothetical protein